ncbi:MAG TPA: acyltransferase family protein [Roseimicrobium sp.]|nr:acyltransferase family protein [Roseimicrobium sp.]
MMSGATPFRGTDSRYLEEIDGLRALAILAVVIFHAAPGWLSGGFLGVDVFFVISGFLITRLILKKTSDGDFSLPEFYKHRAKRLLPVFLLTLGLTWMGGWYLLFPNELQSLGSTGFAACLSFSNYHFAKGSGYFDPQAESNPLLHTWSLAVDEQFYLIFPFLLGLYWKRPERRERFLIRAVAAVAVLFIISLAFTRWKPVQAFYGLESRAWELGVGVLVAVMQTRNPTSASSRFNPALAVSGLLMCVVSFTLFSDTSAVPAPVALLPVVGTALLILTRLGGVGTPLHRLATLPPVRYLGRISYSLYLFHWPVLVYQRAYWGLDDAGPQWSGVLISLALAIIVHHTIENPVRYSRNPVLLARLGWAGLVLMLALAGLAKFVRVKNGYVNAPNEAWLKKVHPNSGARRPPAATFVNIGEPEKTPEFFLLGDSHAQCLVESMHADLLARHLAGAYWVAPSTFPGKGILSSEYSERFSDEALGRIAKGKWKTIIICANWSGYLDVDPNDRKARQRIKNPHLTVEEGHKILGEGLAETIRIFTATGKRVVVVYPVPRLDRHAPIFMARTLMRGKSLPPFLITRQDYLNHSQSALELLDGLKAKLDFTAVLPLGMFATGDGIQYREGNLSYYEDSGHLTRLGASRLVTPMMEALLSR